MKKICCVFMAMVFILSSCDDPLSLSAPFLTPGNSEEADRPVGDVPLNVSATHGERRSITLSWSPVNNAVLYYIYRAGSPIDTFVLSAETSSSSFTFNNVLPGSTVYYRVSSVLADGTESAKSGFVTGTSLAQPVISDISDISEDSASVTWYMENVSANTYRDDLLFIVYCFIGDNEVAQIMVDASIVTENRAVFTGLNANTRYEYQVEAFLRSNQTASEKSEKMDAATARRFRPGPPVDLRASRGSAVNSIALTFALPDMVDIALGDNMFDPKPMYFTVSKRLYSESGNNEYQLVCAYFGTNSATASTTAGGVFFSEYTPGAIVSWTDNNAARGVKYEYLVQSYVDNINRIVSSASSRASAAGWTLANGEIFYGRPVYTLNENGTLFEHAELPFTFDFDPRGEIYTYTVIAKVEGIGDGSGNDPLADFVITSQPLSHTELDSYTIAIDLTQRSSEENPGRGIYALEIEVRIPGETVPIYTFTALGDVQISEDTQPIVVENFRIQDGYADRFVLKWDFYQNRKYIISQSTDRTTWTQIGLVNDNHSNEEDETFIENYEYSIPGQVPGITRYFRIRAARSINGSDQTGQWVYMPTAARTLGIPELSLGTEAAYSVVTPLWKEAQRADSYRIRYRYTEDGDAAPFNVAAEVNKEDLTLDAAGNFRYSFRPQGHNDAQMAGKEIQIVVDALNRGLQTAVGGGEISTSSAEDVRTALVGTALLNLTASRAAYTQDIAVSWNSVPGAGGYYVFRRQFNMNNTAEEGIESIVYYIPASASGITGKNLEIDASNSRADTQTVKAAVSFEPASSRYTLRDMFLTDNDLDSAAYSRHSSAYRNQQNDMVQGMSYRYFVVPVIVRSNIPDPLHYIQFVKNKDGSNKNTDIASFSVRENGVDIQYSGAAALEREGFTIGFGRNVTATKGTYASSGNTNNGIRVTWTPPPLLSTVDGFTPRYTLFRRTVSSNSWALVNTIDNAFSYVDNPQDRSVAYEYAIGISNAAAGTAVLQPQHSRRFIELTLTERDDKNRPNKLGFMLPMVRMYSVSRGEDAEANEVFGERVRWYSAGITNYNYTGNHNWGIEGYEMFVMNRNISANWHSIADITTIPNQVNHNILLTPNNTPSVTITTDGIGTVTRNLLFVLRDYKHFFKVRSYVWNGDEKVYSPDPPYTYTNCINCNTGSGNHTANFTETEYVKWGARQVTLEEFAKIVTIYLAEAFRMSNYWALNTTWIANATASTNHGGGGSFRHRHTTLGGTDMHIEYTNWKQNMQTRVGDWVTFLSIDGKVWASNTYTAWPTAYGRHVGNSASPATNDRRLRITGPADTPHLYSGEMHFGGDGTADMTWTAGQVHLRYPTGSAQRTITLRGQDTPMPFQSDRSHRVTNNAWR